MLALWTVVSAVVLVLVAKRYFSRSKLNLPPGPPGLPIIGNLLQIEDQSIHKTITKWSEQFGDVFKIKILGQDTIILNSFETIWESLVTKSNTFAGRGSSFRSHVLLNHVDNIVYTTFNPKWVHMKKSAINTLKMYGDNLESLEVVSLDWIEECAKELQEASVHGAMDVYPYLTSCTTGIITSIVYGHKVNNAKVQKMMELMDEGMTLSQLTGSGMAMDICPWLRYFPLHKLYSDLLRVSSGTNKWLNTEFRYTKANRDPGNPRCVLDGLFDIQKEDRDKQSATMLNDSDIIGINWDFMTAGVLSTVVTSYALFAVLVNKPEIQRRMADEIKAHIGSRQPRLSDRKTLVYIEAAILEIVRYASTVPLNVPHTTTEDTTINGYDIPKGSQVFMNLWKLHHDPVHWDDPWEFKPERFIDADGTLFPSDHPIRKRNLAFGAGRRICPGKTLARNRLFLMVTSFIQKFEFLPVSEDEKPLHDPRDYVAWIGIKPHRYCVKLVPRD